MLFEVKYYFFNIIKLLSKKCAEILKKSKLGNKVF